VNSGELEGARTPSVTPTSHVCPIASSPPPPRLSAQTQTQLRDARDLLQLEKGALVARVEFSEEKCRRAIIRCSRRVLLGTSLVRASRSTGQRHPMKYLTS
jgi:hypothetical protein